MAKQTDFTEGKIVSPLLKFIFPVVGALFLQAMYGAVDLLVVGQFAETADVSAVATGSQIMMTLSFLVIALAMGTTIYMGHMIGEGKGDRAGNIIGASICLFAVAGAVLTVVIPLFSVQLAQVMGAPKEAFDLTVVYLRTCGFGALAIVAYNLIGAIFRGIGDSKTPLMTVAIACVFNIAGDLILVAVFHMGTLGAALATVGAQLISVVISLLLLKKQGLPFAFSKSMLRFDRTIIKRILRLGAPIALQDFLVGLCFLIILAIVNNIGLIASSSVGVAEKVCGFIMLIPSAFMQSMSAFVAQNIGARKYDRAKKMLLYAIIISSIAGVIMFYISFFHGELLAGIFTNDPEVVGGAAQYLKAYGIDCLVTCLSFCFIGFYNGLGFTTFVMVQGTACALLVRVPAAFIFSRLEPVSLFMIGLGIPISTVAGIIMSLVWLRKADRTFGKLQKTDHSKEL